ncbi:4-hydroxy-tetrahydrodipicolinate synthase [Bacillus sp. B15-48]|uniref:4-hydroxy-tetrahydrodipicolinate synthase n=1 Tax=Bacillus sp. B15-48 TaxID=1548601 RepID=UPI00193EC8B3|nr:4-hydroxy-tetrahydrodipicolinate synthase [Bacillus sp. B15-48]MBM4761042.1 4-hydroxy-tetrahydrodipicolinate synthase [Bacillus sp. B15-48]
MFKPKGIIPALVTPMDRSGNLLEDGLRQVIDYTIEGGVHGVFVLGSTGEIYGLDKKQKQRVLEVTVDHVAGRVPVYAGASEITTKDCIQTAQLAESVGGISAVSVLTPYFITPNQQELADHYRAIAASTKLPIILYGNDEKTNVSISPDTAVELANVENIVGIKDSSGDMTKLGEYIRRTRDKEFTVLVGRDTMIFANLCYGGEGAIASTANVAPKIVSGIYDAYVAGEFEKARELQYKLAPLRLAFGLGSFPVVMKEALNLLGINAGETLGPINEMTSQNREKLIQVLKQMELI